MILTGSDIGNARQAGHVVIEPFSPEYLEPNSYGFHLGPTLIEYDKQIVDSRLPPPTVEYLISEEGLVLEPGRFYLGHTLEKIGGVNMTCELFANLSSAALGIWVQTSAPLGHVGAVIHWTLEICVAQKVRVFPRMRLGKICFWQNDGEIVPYQGRYVNSVSSVASKLFLDSI